MSNWRRDPNASGAPAFPAEATSDASSTESQVPWTATQQGQHQQHQQQQLHHHQQQHLQHQQLRLLQQQQQQYQQQAAAELMDGRNVFMGPHMGLMPRMLLQAPGAFAPLGGYATVGYGAAQGVNSARMPGMAQGAARGMFYPGMQNVYPAQGATNPQQLYQRSRPGGAADAQPQFNSAAAAGITDIMVAGGEYGQQQAMQQQPYNNNMAFGQRDMQHSGSTGSFNNFGNQNNNYGRNDGYGDRGGYGGYQPYAGHSARATVGISQNFAPEEENSPPTWADGLQRFQASLHWRSANNPDLVQEAASSQYSANPYILPAQAQMYQLPGAVDALQQRPFNSAAPDYTAGSADILVTSVGGYGQQQSMLQQPYNHNTAFGQRSMQHSGSTGSFNNFDGGASSASQHQGRNAQVEVFTLEEWNSPLPRDAGLEEMLFQKVNTGMDSGTAEVIVAETSGSNPPESIQSFNEIGLHDIIQQNLQLAGYNEPTAVQRHTIPILLSGRDLMACAQKGSGKTTAFLIPIMSQILTGGPPQIHMTQQRQGVQYPLAVILAPSIELANQIHKESLRLAYQTRIRSVVLYGFPHERLAVENVELERVCHVIVATPGRLKCLLEEGRVSFHLVRYLVLEQVDFIVLKSRHEKSLREVMRLVGPKQPQRKTIMTLTADFKKLTELCEKFLHDFITVSGYAQTEGNFLLRFDINATASIKHQETRNCSDAHKVLAEFGISHRFTRVAVQPQFESGTSSEFPVKLFFVITVRSTQKELIDVQSQCRLHLNRNGIKWANITPLASSQQ